MITIKDVQYISLELNEDADGRLVPVEFSILPFIPQRVFWGYGAPDNLTRGKHAHKLCDQIYICVHGS